LRLDSKKQQVAVLSFFMRG